MNYLFFLLFLFHYLLHFLLHFFLHHYFLPHFFFLLFLLFSFLLQVLFLILNNNYKYIQVILKKIDFCFWDYLLLLKEIFLYPLYLIYQFFLFSHNLLLIVNDIWNNHFFQIYKKMDCNKNKLKQEFLEFL